MPWIDTYVYDHGPCVDVVSGETYQMFVSRCMPALKALDPQLTDEQASEYLEANWNRYIFNFATKITLTLEKPIDPNTVYNSSWLDWQIAEIHSASLPNVTFTSVEKARAATGDRFRIAKSAEDKQVVFGWANIAKDTNGDYPVDWDGDYTDPEDLENAAYTFVLKYRETGEQHQEGSSVGQLIESVMFTKEKQTALGIPEGIVPEGWWVGFHIPDAEVFAKVKSGEYEMFSVEGSAKRVPVSE